MTIEAIIWDIGGVLVRTEDRSVRQALADRFHMTYREMEELVFGGESGRKAQLGEISTVAQWEYVLKVLGLPYDTATRRALEKEFFGGDSLDEELLAYIDGLHRRYKTGIISNALSDTRSLAVEQWGFGPIFDVMVFSAEEGIMKPDRRIFEIALERLGVHAGAAVFIDDFTHNVEGALAVGMKAIQFRSRAQVIADLQAILEAV